MEDEELFWLLDDWLLLLLDDDELPCCCVTLAGVVAVCWAVVELLWEVVVELLCDELVLDELWEDCDDCWEPEEPVLAAVVLFENWLWLLEEDVWLNALWF